MTTSKNGIPCASCRSLAASRSALYGDTNVTRVITPPPLNRHAISPTRRTDSARSPGEKPKSRFKPVRTVQALKEKKNDVKLGRARR